MKQTQYEYHKKVYRHLLLSVHSRLAQWCKYHQPILQTINIDSSISTILVQCLKHVPCDRVLGARCEEVGVAQALAGFWSHHFTLLAPSISLSLSISLPLSLSLPLSISPSLSLLSPSLSFPLAQSLSLSPSLKSTPLTPLACFLCTVRIPSEPSPSLTKTAASTFAVFSIIWLFSYYHPQRA